MSNNPRLSSPPITLEGFPLGINNRAPETAIPDGALREAQNVDIYASGQVKRRPGQTKRYTGTFVHSIWSPPEMDIAYFVDNGTLYKWENNDTETSLSTTVHKSAYMSYAWHNGIVYYSNGLDTGKIVDATRSDWGMLVPARPVTTSTTGNLPAGDYQITWTYIASNGEESGAPIGTLHTLASDGGISVTTPANPASYANMRIYATNVNDNHYRLAKETAAFGTAHTIGNEFRGRSLNTLLGQAPFPGGIVRSYRGRIYIADNEVVWYTTPLNPNMLFPQTDWMLYESDVKMIAPQIDGLYIATEKRTYWIQGNDPIEVQDQHIAHSYGAIPGSDTLIPADWFANENISDRGFAPCWRDSEGVPCVGRPGGAIQRINPSFFKLANYTHGAQVPVTREGLQQLLSSLWQRDGDIASFGDTVVAEVKQQGMT